MATLIINDAAGRARVYDLAQGVTMAGRASSNAIQINDEKSSRQHFKIELRDGEFVLEDAGSTNGTRLNGAKIAAPMALQSGDKIQVGKAIYTFQDGSEPAEAEAPPVALDAATAAEAIASEFSSNAPTMPPKKLDQEIEAERLAAVAAQAAAAAKVAVASKDAKPKLVVKVLEGAGAGKIVELGKEALTVGRHASNTIQIDDEAASNYHAEITQENIGFVVSDLGSTNGTRVKPKDKGEFEKVVKTPLSPGMQILIGKTLLEFQNIGGALPEDDQVFKTMELDPEKLNQRLAQLQQSGGAAGAVPMAGVIGGPAQGGTGAGVKVLIFGGIAALLVAGAIFVPPMLKKGGGTTAVNNPEVKDKPPKAGKSTANLLPNAGFDDGTDDDGYPLEFQVSKAGDAHVRVNPESAYESGGDAQKKGLQISKGGMKSQGKPTLVFTRDAIQIDASKTYEFAGWARNSEDGIYGLHVTWLHGDRDLADNPVVMKDEQPWKELKSAALTPPAWATHVRAGVFAQGKSGKACFDSLVFREKSGPVQTMPPVRFSGIDVQFEGPKGLFSISSQGKPIADDCTLRLETTESKTGTDLVSAMKPSVNKDDGVSFEGKLYDFSLADLVPYGIGAKPGAAGVDLHAEVNLPPDSSSKPMLRFYLISPAAAGEIDVVKGDKTSEHLAANDDKTVAGAKSVLFNAGKAPQLNLVFEKPVELNLKREGKRRLVEIRFDKDVQVSMSPEDVEQRQKMLAAVAEMKKSLGAREWGAAEAKIKSLTEQFGTFQQAQDEATAARAALEAAWKPVIPELQKFDESLKAAYNDELRDTARAAIQRYSDAWKGSDEKLTAIAAPKAAIETTIAKYADAAVDIKAQEYLKQARNYYDKGIYNVALSFIDAKLLNDPVFSKTKAAEEAQKLRPEIEKAMREGDDIKGITQKLKDLAEPLFKQGKVNEAIRTVETDPEYKANKAKLKDINDLLEEWRKKK